MHAACAACFTPIPLAAPPNQQFDSLKGIVRSLRNARVEYNVEVGRKIGATIVVADDAARAAIRSELPVSAGELYVSKQA